MKVKKLKIEGEEKLKIELKFDLDELRITIFDGGKPTKYTDVLTFNMNYDLDDSTFEVNFIGETIQRLYLEYLKGKKVEKKLLDLFEDKENIELKIL